MKMKRYTQLLPLALFFASILASSSTALAGEKAIEIMQKVEDRDIGDNGSSRIEMILIDKRGKERLRKIKKFTKDKGEDTLTLIFFLYPSDVKDTGFLTYDYDDEQKDDDQWLYLPALKKTKRIASSDKSGSFMGSDFTYADMTSRNLADYEFKILQEGAVKKEKVWIIEAKPNEKAIDETGYTKSVLFVRQDNYVVIRAKHWLKDGGKNKYLDIKKLELIDKVWVATQTTMTTKKGKQTLHKTILNAKDVKFNQGLKENQFTVRRLEKGL